MSKEVAESASKEWDYRYVDSSIMDKQWRTSIPCQLKFEGQRDQDIDQFHTELRANGYSPMDKRADKKQTEQKAHYEGEVMNDDHYNRVKVLVFRDGIVRLYPKDEYVPTVEELSKLIEALESGFGSGLKHCPIEQS